TAGAWPCDQALAAVATGKQAAEQIAPRRLVRAPLRVRKQRPDRHTVGGADDPGPLRCRDDLAVVCALAADPRRRKHSAPALRRPLRPCRRRDAALVQTADDR